VSLHPVIPSALLAILAVTIVMARVIVLRRMTKAERTTRALWRWGALTAAALLLVLAAARPVLGADQDSTRVADPNAPNVFLLLDRSADMEVRDAGGDRSRMAAAREDVAAVIDRYPGARFAVIGFASRASLDWPLTPDAWSLRPVMSAVMPYASTPDDAQLANAAAAGNLLRYQLISAVQQYPLAQNLVFYFGAGARESRSPQGQFNLPDSAVDGGAVLGYGAAEAIDEQRLRTVGEQIGVPYLHRDDVSPLDAALPAVDPSTLAATVAPPARTESYWLFAVGAAALLLGELYLVLREFRRTRMLTAEVVG